MLNNKWYNKGKMMIEDVTNSPKDWEDFWYNSTDDFPNWTNNINPSDTMTIHSTKDRKSFDELYEEYSSMSLSDQLNNLKNLGRDLFNKLDKIIDNLDTILKEDSSK